MTDEQLQTALADLRPETSEWLIVKRETDKRATGRREDRRLWLFAGAVAAVAFGVLLIVVFV